MISGGVLTPKIPPPPSYGLANNKGCAGRLHTQRPVFYINNSAVEYVEQWRHLGHVISSDLDDKHDISRGRSALVRSTMSCVSLERLTVLPN